MRKPGILASIELLSRIQENKEKLRVLFLLRGCTVLSRTPTPKTRLQKRVDEKKNP